MSIFSLLTKYLIIAIIIVLILYFTFCIILNKYHKLYYGKGTIKAFLPIFNIYLLGKLASGKSLATLFLFLCLLMSNLSFNIKQTIFDYNNGYLKLIIKDHDYSRILIPTRYMSMIRNAYYIFLLLAFIAVIVKSIKLKRSNRLNNIDDFTPQTTNTIIKTNNNYLNNKDNSSNNAENDNNLPINTNIENNTPEFDTTDTPDFVKNPNNNQEINQNYINTNDTESTDLTPPSLDNIAPGVGINTNDMDKPAIIVDENIQK